MKQNSLELLLFFLIVLAVACKEDKIEVYQGPDAINLFVLVNSKQVSSAQVPLGFLDESVQDSTVYVVANIQGVISNIDRTIQLQVPDSVKGTDSVNYEFSKEVTLPAGATSVNIPVKIKREGLKGLTNGFDLVIAVAQSNNFLPGVYKSVTITATDDMPTQWIGYTNWFPYYLGTCTKTKYRFVYATLGKYDFTDVGKNYNILSVYKKYLNTKLDEYEAVHGVRLWDSDLNANVTFP